MSTNFDSTTWKSHLKLDLMSKPHCSPPPDTFDE